MTKTSSNERRYGNWAGCSAGVAEDVTRCIETVMPNERGAVGRQCGRSRGHGPDKLYCTHHNPIAVQEREQHYAQRRQRFEAEQDAITARAEELGRLLDVVAVGAVQRVCEALTLYASTCHQF